MRLPIRDTRNVRLLRMTAVWVHEVGLDLPDEKPLDWMLLTN
jgi:hypothetical protein